MTKIELREELEALMEKQGIVMETKKKKKDPPIQNFLTINVYNKFEDQKVVL